MKWTANPGTSRKQAGPAFLGGAWARHVFVRHGEGRHLNAVAATEAEALAATMNLPSDTLSDEIEPYLLREQFIVRTPRGRVATPRAFQLLGKPVKSSDSPPSLFDQ